MTVEEVRILIARGEGTRIEYKECNGEVPSSFYETVASFLNKEGGTILLGVTDDQQIKGVPKDKVQTVIKNIVSSVNDSSLISPPVTVQPIQIEVDGETIIVVKLNVSSQVHECRQVIYDRENDLDIRITDEARIKEVYFRKRQIFTESEVYKHLRMEDLDIQLFEKARNIIRGANPGHPWLLLTDMEMLRSSALYRRDFQSGEEGLTLAAALIFGKDETIQSLLPSYKIEAMVRIKNIDRWDDRIYPPLRTNLIDSYLAVMDFIRKHLSSKFHTDENGQRIDLRELIFREVVGNIIVHREYTNGHPTELLIYRNKVVATNPNRAMFKGPLDIQSFSPYAKNPNIRKFFTAFGWTDEIGSGIRNVVKYLRHYTLGGTPLFLEDDLFRTEIPLEQTSLSVIGPHFLQLLNLSTSDSKLLSSIPLCSDFEKADPDAILFGLVSRWHELGVKMRHLDWMIVKSLSEEAWETVQGWEEKGSAFIGRKGLYLLQILVLCIEPKSMDELLVAFGYNNRNSFRERYLAPLMEERLLERTLPDKPSSRLQRYRTTSKGQLFLGGNKIL